MTYFKSNSLNGMHNMEYKLLALDLDGTLLNDKEGISKKNLSMIEKASRAGTKIVLTTGRSYPAARPYIRMVNVPEPAITYNGAVIQNGEKILRKITIENRIIQGLLKILKDMDYSPIIYLTDNNRYFETLGRYKNEFLQFSRRFAQYLIKVDNISERNWENVIRITVIAGEHDVPLLHSVLKKNYGFEIKTIDTYFAEWNFWLFEILNKESSKSKGLDYLCGTLNVNREEVIAVGDNNNDLDMISWAGLGIAMKNGLTAILREADYVTENSNNDDGVAEVIEKFIFRSYSL